MSLNIHLLKKWTKMIFGKSIYHVDQGVGKHYSKRDVGGFYNDLTEKVYKEDDNVEIPITLTDDGKEIYFPIGIAQYGLGAFDIYIETHDDKYLRKAQKCASWLLEHQNEHGGWSNFEFEFPNHPYSSMAQSEAACLFMRLYTLNKDSTYLDAAKGAIDFMLVPLENGGTATYDGDDIYLHEYTHPSNTIVLNGWIFSVWCLYDYVKITEDENIAFIYQKTVNSLAKSLPLFDCGYWSYYDFGGKLTSPFYHDLHIAQLKVMYDLTANDVFDQYAKKWERYNESLFKKTRAFIKKAIQKITEHI